MTNNWIVDIWPFSFEYARAEVLWLLLVIPCLVVWHIYSDKAGFKNINLPSTRSFGEQKFNWTAFFRHANLGLFLFGLAFVILALARPHAPQDIDEFNKKNIEGIDVVISMDISGSMLAEDIKPNRLTAAKTCAKDFILERPNDRIGLVVYEGEAYTASPLTTGHELLIQQLEDVESGMVVGGTAIGLGLITAVNRLIESDAKSKVIILMTDGMNNSGDIMPEDAAQIAKEMGVCVYTIGMGKEGGAEVPLFGGLTSTVPTELDEELLTDIANMTGGKYFRAQNKKELENIYSEIDLLEKSKVKVLDFKISPPEKYYGFLLLGIIFILSFKVIQNTLLKSIP